VALSPLFAKYGAKNGSNIVNEARKVAHPLKEGNLNGIRKEIERFVHECAGR
jgi:cobalamin biosynthesis protein CobD/CbiB